MFVQMHLLQSMPPGNLNRDDTGQPKKCLFGGTTRGRISSQCLKRNMRLSQLFQSTFGGALARRTKYLPRLVGDALLDAGGFPADEVSAVKAGIAALFSKESKAKKEPREKDADAGGETDEADERDVTPQLVFFPPPFATKLASLVVALKTKHPKAYALLIAPKKKKGKATEEDKAVAASLSEFKAAAFRAKESMSIDIGLFGRMTTSDLIADVEAACQVAHAISTHETLVDEDYFTAMDDLQQQFMASQVRSGGAGFVSAPDKFTFFNSAVYYKYLNVDVAALAKTLGEGGETHARRAAAVLAQAAALATPTGKQNNFAAHSVPELILVEVSATKQPISYANAFLQAVQGADLMQESAQALGDYCGSIAAAYAPADTRRFLLAVGSAARASFPLKAERAGTLAELAAAVEEAVSSPARAGAR